jgi:hypothetical protein
MATCATNAQAVGVAAALCHSDQLYPGDLLVPDRMHRLQQALLRAGQHIPGVPYTGDEDLARTATIAASSSLQLADLSSTGEFASTERPYALLLPLQAGPVPAITLYARVERDTKLRAELWISSREGNATPDIQIATLDLPLSEGAKVPVRLEFEATLKEQTHVFIVVNPQSGVALHLSAAQLPGILTLSQKMNAAVAKSLVQSPPDDSGIDTFAFWLPERRPHARLLAATFDPPLCLFCPANAINQYARPWRGTNAWTPAPEDKAPALRLNWHSVQTIQKLSITFDTDFDHPMESVLLSHPERIMPGCITAFRVTTAEGDVLAHIEENHQTLWSLTLPKPVKTKGIQIEILAHGDDALPAIFNVSCW